MSKNNNLWGDDELKDSLTSYLIMLKLELKGERYVKSNFYNTLAEKHNRNTDTYVMRMQNISYLMHLNGRPWIKGLKPLANIGVNVLETLERLLSEIENRELVNSDLTFEANVEKQRKNYKKKDLVNIPEGNRTPEAKTVTSTNWVRDPKVKSWILENAKGKCENCNKKGPFKDINDNFFLEVHHVIPLSESGPDVISNAIAVCPNCHRKFHYAKDKNKLREKVIKSIDRLNPYEG